jgi:hypothetical protein
MPFRSRIGTFCHPQDALLISRQSSREIGFRVVANLVGTFLVLSKTPNPDGSQCRCHLVVLSRDSCFTASPNLRTRFRCHYGASPSRRGLILRHLSSTQHDGHMAIVLRSFGIPPATISTTVEVPKSRSPIHVRVSSSTSPLLVGLSDIARSRFLLQHFLCTRKPRNAEPRLLGILRHVSPL